MLTPASLLAAGLERILNQYLRLDPDVLPKAAALTGKAVAVDFSFTPAGERGARLILYFLPSAAGLRITESFAGDPDTVIRGAPLALLSQFRNGGRSLETGVAVLGDIEVGRAFQELLGSVDIDWEEQLSVLLGDTAAHQVGNALRGLRAWGRQALDTLLKNTAEYFQEEARDLPSSGAMADFLDTVDALRSATDRLEARIRRLQQALEATSDPE